MRKYKLYIKRVFGGLSFHCTGSLFMVVAEQARFNGMGYQTLIQEV